MLNREYAEDGIKFSLQEEASIELIPINKWQESGAAFQYTSLQSLVDNGYGVQDEYHYNISFAGIYELDAIEREMIDLPPLYPFDIYIQADGQITRSDFKYAISYRTFAPSGDILKVISRKGAILSLEVQDYLLSRGQLAIVSAIEEFNNLPAESKIANRNLSCFASIKELSKSSATILDTYLCDKDVVLPNKVKININYQDGVLDIAPTIDDECGEKFSYAFDRLREVRDNYPVARADGGKTHVVVSEGQKSELQKIKSRYRKVQDKKLIDEIIENPELFFDAEAIDISELYSDRVIKIGLYEPKFYSFVSPYKSQWIPGYRVVDRTNGTTNLVFRSYQELALFKDEINQAEERNDCYVEFRGVQLSITDALRIEEDARAQLDRKQSVNERGTGSEEEVKKQREVLIIEENTESLGYTSEITDYKSIKSLKLHNDKYLNLNIKLKEHQRRGIAWLQYLLLRNAKGCLLADDMGLGKTLQLLYLIDWHSRENCESNKPYLIVAPVSLLENWEQEYAKFFDNPRLSVMRVSGAPKQFDKKFIEALSQRQIVLTSYETIRSGQLNFGVVDFAIIVLDEAQKVKTPGTLVTNAAKALKGDFKVAMTGTPVENSFIDLWCITDFSIPGLLGNAKEFAKKYHHSLKKSGADVVAMGNEIREKIGHFILRRLKSDIADELPTKLTEYNKTPMPKVQLERYKLAINMGIEDSENPEGTKSNMLSQIMNVRCIVDHPFILDRCVDNYSMPDIIASSAKLLSTFNILDKIKSKGEKVIIFTERRDMQRILQNTIYFQYGISPRLINGETATKEGVKNLSRQQTIDHFQSTVGFNVIIMSPLAAGMGLNVVGANHVIHYTRHWNPAKENQATDRAYRIGQTKDVTVYYPMAVSDEFDTFDVVLDKMLGAKSQLATSSLYPSEMIEVDKQEIFNTLFDGRKKVDTTPLNIQDIDNLNGYMFEALVAIYYREQGFDVALTTRGGDKGVDVVAFSDRVNYAIQCKHSKNNVGREGVNEIIGGVRYYELKHNCKFKPVIFTNSFYTLQAEETALLNSVETIDRGILPNFIESTKLSLADIYAMEGSREA